MPIMPQLRIFNAGDISKYHNKREGETKIGETIQTAEAGDLGHILALSSVRFVLLGIPEDIGVRANSGIGGAHTAWQSFLKVFLNLQDTSVFRGVDFMMLGEMDCTDLMIHCEGTELIQLRNATGLIDAKVYPLIQTIIEQGKIPVVIGGGHNNAYPLLKGASKALDKPVNVINLDAHSDFRMMEGRHSGNGFRYAYHEAFLKKYAMLGLHEAYNSEGILAELKSNADLLPVFWEDIFLRQQMDWTQAIAKTIEFVATENFGVELDVDCIEHVLSSAATPVGIHTHHALQYLYQCGLQPDSIYLHLPEGVTDRADGQHSVFTGKLLSYLVQAFIKGVNDRLVTR
jgi:formiminoglutamase